MSTNSKPNKFLAGLAILGLIPVLILSGILGISWFIEFEKQCGFSLSYSCGTDKSFKTALFAVICFASAQGIKKLWQRIKSTEN